MAIQQEVLKFIADFKGVGQSELSETSPLGLTSLAAQRFRVALKRKHGIDVPDGDFKMKTVGEVLGCAVATNLSEQPRVPPDIAPLPTSGVVEGDLGIGIDIEPIESFRTSSDPESDPLFLNLFTPAEFGYCLLQSDPAQHFAARFCAKEALRKCGRDYLAIPFNQIEVLHDSDGSPYYHLPSVPQRLTHVSLSLSHTKDLAIAVAALRK